jgi:excisionase family DNA binding protein
MTDQQQIEPLWTPDQVAERLQLSRQHIYRLCGEHRLPFLRVGNSLRFRAADIEAWLEAKIVKAIR